MVDLWPQNNHLASNMVTSGIKGMGMQVWKERTKYYLQKKIF